MGRLGYLLGYALAVLTLRSIARRRRKVSPDASRQFRGPNIAGGPEIRSPGLLSSKDWTKPNAYLDGAA